jgi:hypothetical protein
LREDGDLRLEAVVTRAVATRDGFLVRHLLLSLQNVVLIWSRFVGAAFQVRSA